MNILHSAWLRLGAWCLLFLMLVMGLFSRRGFMDWRQMVHQNKAIKGKKEMLSQRKIQIETQIERLQLDPNEKERIIRQQLGYIRSDETIIEFDSNH